MPRHRYTSRPHNPLYGYIFLIKEGIGAGSGYTAFDGNVFPSAEAAHKFLDEVTGGDEAETRRISSHLKLVHATAEEAEMWREAKG